MISPVCCGRVENVMIEKRGDQVEERKMRERGAEEEQKRLKKKW